MLWDPTSLQRSSPQSLHLQQRATLGIPQVYKEVLPRVFTSSKEPLLVPDLDVLGYVREVGDPLPLSHLDAFDGSRPVVVQSEVKGPVEPEDL